MAVTIHGITNVDGDSTKSYQFCGLSTDSKPTEMDGKPIETNSLFWEMDSGDFYYFDGSSWAKLGTEGGGGGMSYTNPIATVKIVNTRNNQDISYAAYQNNFLIENNTVLNAAKEIARDSEETIELFIPVKVEYGETFASFTYDMSFAVNGSAILTSNITVSDLVNATEPEVGSIEVTDITQPCSLTFTIA